MSNIQALYQEVILDHNKNPRNFGQIANANHQAEGHNPLCGDHIKIGLNLVGDNVQGVTFEGVGCAICKASSSMMTVAIKGKSKAEVLTLIEEFRAMVIGDLDVEDASNHHLGHLKIFSNIKTLPVRVKCAILPWHTLSAALNNQQDEISSVSTES